VASGKLAEVADYNRQQYNNLRRMDHLATPPNVWRSGKQRLPNRAAQIDREGFVAKPLKKVIWGIWVVAYLRYLSVSRGFATKSVERQEKDRFPDEGVSWG
jgi:hypothetical protein